MSIFGDKGYVTQVRPGSDAAAKVHLGDQIVNFNGYELTRADSFDIGYFFHLLAPAPVEKLDIQAPDGSQRTVLVKSAIRQSKVHLDISNQDSEDLWELIREDEAAQDRVMERIIETDKVMYWKMATFGATNSEIEGIFDKARTHPALILDLRGNSGGYVITLESVVGQLFDHEVKIADRVGRKIQKGHETQRGKRVRKPFTGKLFVLVDSGSASCSELLARVIQLEHRGIVLGDKTAGAVMEARGISNSVGLDAKIFYRLSVTSANLTMTDGQSLEKIGVTPDELLLPTPEDLATGRDPVMSRAAALAEVKLDPTEAGKMFPYLWEPLQ